jgi:maltose O-acetyltransferase
MPGVKFDSPHSFLTSIGDDCVIAPKVGFLNHDASTFIYNRSARIGKIIIKENCFIGANSILLPGIEIGPNTIIGAGSVVTTSIPPNSIAAGNPAKVIKSLDGYFKSGDISGSYSINSNELYPNIHNRSFINNIKSEMPLFGYTVGSDSNRDYYFNTTNH